MAPKPKQTIASSSAAAASTTVGGSSSHEAPVSGKWNGFSPLRTRGGSVLLTSFWSFKNFCWSWSVDADLTGPRLICECGPCVEEQNTDLVIWRFFALSMRSSRLQIEREFRELRVLRLLNAALVLWDSRLSLNDLETFSKCGVQTRAPCGPHVSVTERGSHVLSLVFEPQHLVWFHCSQSTNCEFSFFGNTPSYWIRECITF